jgi:hypothetical protein
VVTTVDEHVDIIGDIFKLSINDPEGAACSIFTWFRTSNVFTPLVITKFISSVSPVKSPPLARIIIF